MLEDQDFLVLNPAEVLVIVIQTRGESGGSREMFPESGLIDFVYRGPVGPPCRPCGR